MSRDNEQDGLKGEPSELGSSAHGSDEYDGRDRGRYRDEVFSKRVPAGKRTYFFDVKTTRSGEDYFITITESKRVDEGRYEKHKIFLYKEDFGKFVSAVHEVMRHVRTHYLPDYEFRGMPEIPPASDRTENDDYNGDY